jgi:signal transduction histidine kinase
MQRLAICNFIPGQVASGSPGKSGSIPILIFCVIFFATSSFTLTAQDIDRSDSLKSILQTQGPADQYETLIELTKEYADKDNKQSLEYIDQAYNIAFTLGDTVMIVRSGRLKGQILRRMDRLDEAMAIFDELLPIAKRNNLEQHYKLMLNSLAIAHTDRGEYHKALECHFQSLQIREREGDKGEISITLDNIGLVYYKLNDYTKAIEYYERSIELKEQAEGDYGEYITLINLGHCYIGLNRFEKARQQFAEGLKVCGDECPVNLRIDAEYGLGLSHFRERDLDLAMTHLNNSYKMAVGTDNKRFQAENLILLSEIAIDEQQYDSALVKLNNAERLAQASGYTKLLIDIYRHLSTLYKKEENFEKASFYQDKYIELKDSIFSEGLIKNIASIQTKLEERENIKTIATQDEELEKQRNLNVAIIIIAVLATALVFMLFRSNRARRRANERLDSEVKAATKDLKAANQLLAEVNKELDHFIYKTSHDIRGPLATLKGLCNVALTDVEDSTALKYLNKLDFTATQLDTLLRRLQKINQINNASVQMQDINFSTIVDHVEILEGRKGLPPRLTLLREIGDNIRFSSDRELVTLILENLIANAVKFHDTSDRVDPFVKVRIEQNDDDVVIRVIDNGIGIGEVDPEELFHIFARASERSMSGGIGLYLSRRAAQKLGGKIDLHSTAEGYTEVVVTLPINAIEAVVVAED